ncbi:13567_t:CDS:2, partial [Dentiscutata heterogama]
DLVTTTPTDITCNDCNKAILNIFVDYFKTHPESAAGLPVSRLCTLFKLWLQQSVVIEIPDTTSSMPTSSSAPPDKGSQLGCHKNGMFI